CSVTNRLIDREETKPVLVKEAPDDSDLGARTCSLHQFHKRDDRGFPVRLGFDEFRSPPIATEKPDQDVSVVDHAASAAFVRNPRHPPDLRVLSTGRMPNERAIPLDLSLLLSARAAPSV